MTTNMSCYLCSILRYDADGQAAHDLHGFKCSGNAWTCKTVESVLQYTEQNRASNVNLPVRQSNGISLTSCERYYNTACSFISGLSVIWSSCHHATAKLAV